MNPLAVVSGCDHDRTLAAANHQHYADRQGILYVHDTAPTPHGGTSYKLDKIAKFLRFGIADRIFWIDDDAFFMQPERSLMDFVESNPGPDLIFCRSPINHDPHGNPIWTYLSSGNFFIRNSARSREFVRRCLEVPHAAVREWWNEERDGFLTNGDQDVMVYLLKTDDRFRDPAFFVLLPYEAFNTRPFHFHERPDEHFVVHFTGTDKRALVADFARRFGLNEALIPDDVLTAMHGLRAPIRE